MRVFFGNQFYFPCSLPILQLFFFENCVFNPFMKFIPNKFIYIVSRGESLGHFLLVLINSSDKIIGNPYVEDTICFVCKYIGITAVILHLKYVLKIFIKFLIFVVILSLLGSR